MVNEYHIMKRCFMSIEMVICMFQKIAAHDSSFSTVLVTMCVFSEQ